MHLKGLILFLFLSSITLFGENRDIHNLLEKVHQEANMQEKQKLIEELKQKLARVNKNIQEEAEAIMKAKTKSPLSTYSVTESSTIK